MLRQFNDKRRIFKHMVRDNSMFILCFSHAIYKKINLKCIKDSHIEGKNMKLLQKNIGVNTSDLAMDS